MLISLTPRPSRYYTTVLTLITFHFALVLYIQRRQLQIHLAWKGIASLRTPILRQEDRWIPTDTWDPLASVYDNFTGIGGLYAWSIPGMPMKNLSTSSDISVLPPNRRPLSSLTANLPFTCFGPREEYIHLGLGEVSRQHAFAGSYPEPLLGSNTALGLPSNICHERYEMFSSYGLQESYNSSRGIDWDTVDWGSLQNECIARNKQAFDLSPRPDYLRSDFPSSKDERSTQRPHRSAIVFRSHDTQAFTPDLKRNMRAVIDDLVLKTSGQYQAFLLVEIKDANARFWADDRLYEDLVARIVPPEFRNMTILWNEWRWRDDYPLIPEDTLLVHKSQWLPMQFFQKMHPEFDFYWNWEMDVRYTGRYSELIQVATDWAASQPRKGLWERNSRFYIQRLHGSYQQYRRAVQERYRHGKQDTTIWGPLNSANLSDHQKVWLARLNITPPVPTPSEDAFTWGMGEDADFITFLPLFDPDTTKYVYQDAYFNYPPHLRSEEMPRRTAIITFSRVSARLLRLMELENTAPPGHHLSSESWPQTVALHYGLKAVTIPHSIYMDRFWPAQAADWIFNNGDYLAHSPDLDKFPPGGRGAGGPESTFGLGREHNWAGSTWYYQNRLAETLYKRWLGWDIEGVGGPAWEERNGQFCLPPILLHPVKSIEDPSIQFRH